MEEEIMYADDVVKRALKKLEAIVTARTEYLKRTGLPHKAFTIASELGRGIAKSHGNYLIYPPITIDEYRSHTFSELSRKYGLLIVADDYVFNVDVYCNGEHVLSVSRDTVYRFVPESDKCADWIGKVEELYLKARESMAVSQTEREIKKIVEKCEKFGVDIDEVLSDD